MIGSRRIANQNGELLMFDDDAGRRRRYLGLCGVVEGGEVIEIRVTTAAAPSRLRIQQQPSNPSIFSSSSFLV